MEIYSIRFSVTLILPLWDDDKMNAALFSWYTSVELRDKFHFCVIRCQLSRLQAGNIEN